MKNDYIEKINEGERRYFSPQIEVRADDEKMIEGIASVVDKEYDLGYFSERIARGAFDEVLQDDVVALFNHDNNYPLARTGADGDGNLKLYLNDNGDLAYSFKIPNTTVGRDLAENIKNGVIRQSSFAFSIEAEEWEFANDKNKLDMDRRTITKIKRLYDVSPVTFPASPSTTVAARNAERLHEEDEQVKNKIKLDKYNRDKYYRNKTRKNGK